MSLDSNSTVNREETKQSKETTSQSTGPFARAQRIPLNIGLSTNRVKDYCAMCLQCSYKLLYFIALLALLCSLFIAEIVIGALYKQKVLCSSDVIDIPFWLIFDGIAGFFQYNILQEVPCDRKR